MEIRDLKNCKNYQTISNTQKEYTEIYVETNNPISSLECFPTFKKIKNINGHFKWKESKISSSSILDQVRIGAYNMS